MNERPIKRALVLSGGSVLGAYQIGAVRELCKKYKYDIICGVSVGAMNAAYMAMFTQENLPVGIQRLEAMWSSLEEVDVYKSWCCGMLSGLWKNSFRNSEPLKRFIFRNLKEDMIRNSGIELRIGMCDIQNGKYKVINQNDENLKKSVYASAAYPAMFSPMEIDGSVYVDGGIRNITPIKSAIDSGATHIDVVMTHPINVGFQNVRGANAIDIARRSIEIMMNEIMNNDIEVCSKNVHIQVIRPAAELSDDSFNFDKELIKQYIWRGSEDAKRII